MNESPSLAKLSLLLNSHHDHKKVIQIALEYIKGLIEAEAATLFLLNETHHELIFWAIHGGAGEKLSGSNMPLRGIVGWVIESKQSAIVRDTKSDKRFFDKIDEETSFKTKDLLCVPLIVRGNTVIGAIEIINSKDPQGFTDDELSFLEQVAGITALAVDNAKLVSTLTKRTHELEELNKKKEDMLNIIAHEFRTPLNIIQMSAELLSGNLIKSPQEGSKIYKALSRSIEQLTHRLVDVKNATTSDFDVALDKQACELSTIIQAVLDIASPLLSNRRLTLTSNNFSTTVHCDSSLIVLALCNLVKNAIRFTPDDGSISIESGKSGGFIRIAVKDSGIGIPKNQQEAIFEKFFEGVSIMAHSSGDSAFQSAGLGLGLPSARAILRAHKGNISVESTPSAGSTFTLLIPE